MNLALLNRIVRIVPDKLPPDLPAKIGKIDGITVFIVDGDIVKRQLEMNFVEGGNDMVYDFIPEKQIWLDGRLGVHELPFVLFHELTERKLMEEKKLPYDKAHERASTLEVRLRDLAALFRATRRAA